MEKTCQMTLFARSSPLSLGFERPKYKVYNNPWVKIRKIEKGRL
jgi:hypothetical protein